MPNDIANNKPRRNIKQSMGGRAKGLEGQERVGLLIFRKEIIPMQYQDFEEMLYGTNYNVHSTK